MQSALFGTARKAWRLKRPWTCATDAAATFILTFARHGGRARSALSSSSTTARLSTCWVWCQKCGEACAPSHALMVTPVSTLESQQRTGFCSVFEAAAGRTGTDTWWLKLVSQRLWTQKRVAACCVFNDKDMPATPRGGENERFPTGATSAQRSRPTGRHERHRSCARRQPFSWTCIAFGNVFPEPVVRVNTSVQCYGPTDPPWACLGAVFTDGAP